MIGRTLDGRFDRMALFIVGSPGGFNHGRRSGEANDRGSRLLGGQIVGKEGAAKRIDVIATALHAGMTVDEMIHLDLSYAPPYAPVWDPVLIAARVLLKRL